MSFFGSRQEQSRHKFYTASPNPKTPSLDLRLWSYWWGATKPSKNKPALLFYRGEGRFIYDRITINATEAVISCQRSDTSTDTIEQLQASMKAWIESIDGLSAFLDKADFDNSRWVIQDLSASLRYHTPISEADFRRFDCLRTIYEVVDHDKLLFKLLRSDQADIGLSPAELRTLQLLRENEGIQASEVAEELEISVDDAGDVLGSIRDKLVDTPDILDKQFSNLPTFKFTASGATVTYAIDLPRIVRYISILREILANPTDSKLDDVCPRRVETVGTAVADIPVVELGEDDGLDFLDELLGEIADIGVVAAAEVKDVPKQAKKVQAKGASNSLATYLLNQLREFDSETYDPDDTQILRKCDRPRQPIVLTPAEMEGLRGGDYDPTITSASVLDVSDPDGHIICPEFWCTHDRIPLTADQLGDPKKCPVCGGGIRSKDASVEKTQDIVQFPVIQRDSTIIFPGYVKYKSKKNGKQIPCCFTTKQTTKIGSTKSDSLTAAEAYYVLGETKAQLGSLRLGYIPRIVGRAIGIPLKYTDTISAGNRIQTGQSGFYRVGVGHAAETLPNVLGVPGKIRTPAQNPEVTLRCSFFRSWKGAESGNDIEARIASIDKAFKSKELSSIEELEYTALALECQLFVLYIVDGSVQVGCFMNIGAVRSVNRSVAVMVTEGDPEYICNVSRITTVPQFTANLHKVAIYPPEILKTLTILRGKACTSDIPTIDDTFVFINSMPSLKNKVPEMKVILDPYKRAQALFIPELVFLPFKPTSQIPTFLDEKVVSLSDIPEEELPYKGDILDFLAEAVRFHPGFEYAHDLSNRGRVTEIITRSGLRIPVQSEDTANGGEIVETVRANTEEQLVWGKPDKASEATKRTITYEAELFDFLLYQLSHDIQGEDYRGLRTALSADHPDIDELEPLLKAWIDDTLTFTEADVPPAFVRKLRSPCSTGNCSGSLCAWDGASCRVEVKRVRDSLQRAPLERRLLNTLLTNDKIRNVVWEHRSSPFFSSVLYLEAPTELILSDTDVSKRLK
jgi:DNA-binding CsgD family transcriptional regulator